MSWQRIDENTYIDDTLVTCAEYQLFIDEMREQGKYYQPDHWISYRFPKGQARKPILGMRHSDAIAFCEWLTRREGKEWVYCLPHQKEATEFSINASPETSIGYWLTGFNNQSQFVWVAPESQAIYISQTSAYYSLLNRDLASELNLSREFNLGTSLEHLNIGAIDIELSLMLDPISAIIQDVDIDIVPSITDAIQLASNYNSEQYYRLAITHSRDLQRAGFRALEYARDFAARLKQDCTNAPVNALIRCLVSILNVSVDLSHLPEYKRSLAINRDLTNILALCTNLLILQERIAGRSPAFEGIRLVKERIR